MRKDIVIPLLALVGGAAGFALRRVQLRTGFESDTGLAIPGCPAALALIVLSAAVAAAPAAPLPGKPAALPRL